jgi:hypothetical protein
MTTIYAVHEDDAQVEKALTAFAKSAIESRHLRILALNDTNSAFHARRAGVSANVALGLAAAPHEERGRKERIKDLLEESGLKGKAYEGLVHAIERGQLVIAVNVPEEQAERAKNILSLQERP